MLVVDVLCFVDDPVLNPTLFLSGLILLTGSLFLRASLMRCPGCGRSIAMHFVRTLNHPGQIRYCPYCSFDLRSTSES